ncbi:MAG: 3-phosphoshikimate 1-carboxyvinyltransferase [Bacteroidales bacterium]|jgi:3-phosphoshikimate 1-carboxyvinyltransferase|nr:3-phosphoshikimate 1-carboxyvinyltransferase [Bacteroidales bacterium]
MDYTVKFSGDTAEANIDLPSSKSISNRLLIIRALSAVPFEIGGLSDSDDTRVLLEGLRTADETVNIGHAGTSMRFLTAYFAATGKEKIITGSERMQQRPISELTDALNQIGANIQYLGKKGYPPVRTSGKPLTGNVVHINGNVSSQFISALLLIAPALPNGLTIRIAGDPVSSSYVKMTLSLMRQAGVTATQNGKTIVVPPQRYSSEGFICERDWSAASYWYEIAALTKDARILLCGATQESIQGDAVVTDIFRELGVETVWKPEGALLVKRQQHKISPMLFDFINSPDLVQTTVVTLCLKRTPFRFSGVKTLRIKETDRIVALQNELQKLGFNIEESRAGVIEWDGQCVVPQKDISIATYHDHRMAMAFAPAAMLFPGIRIEDAGVVSKSYPSFWSDAEKAGFSLQLFSTEKTSVLE